MAINLRSTSSVHQDGAKIVVYGVSGAGKTRLASTLPTPIIISAESGLLSLSEFDLPFIEVNSYESLKDAYEWASNSKESEQFESIAIDSLSEIGEVILAHEKKVNKDVPYCIVPLC